MNKVTITKTVALLVAIALALGSCATVQKVTGEVVKEIKATDGVVQIPVKRVDDGKAHFYYVAIDNTKVVFFVVMTSDGVYRTAFDACAEGGCGTPRSRFSQSEDGSKMVCYHCQVEFSTRYINEGNRDGICNPAPLDRKYDESFVTIALADLREGSRYFEEEESLYNGL